MSLPSFSKKPTENLLLSLEMHDLVRSVTFYFDIAWDFLLRFFLLIGAVEFSIRYAFDVVIGCVISGATEQYIAL